MSEGEGRGMDDVLAWLFNEGSSSMLGGDGDTMSTNSLQVGHMTVDSSPTCTCS